MNLGWITKSAKLKNSTYSLFRFVFLLLRFRCEKFGITRDSCERKNNKKNEAIVKKTNQQFMVKQGMLKERRLNANNDMLLAKLILIWVDSKKFASTLAWWKSLFFSKKNKETLMLFVRFVYTEIYLVC